MLRHIKDPRAVKPMIEFRIIEARKKEIDFRAMKESLAAITEMISNNIDVEALIIALKDPDVDIRRKAERTIINIGIQAAQPLIAALKDDDAELRSKVVCALGEIKDSRAVEPLIGILRDKSSGVRQEAIVSLGKIGDRCAVEPLIAMLNDEDERVVDVAADVFWYFKDVRAVEPLIGSLKRQPSARIIEALGELGDPRAVEPLVNLLKDNYYEDNVLRALGKLKDSRAVEPIIAKFYYFLGRSHYSKEAVRALGQIGDPRAVEPLIRGIKQYSNPGWDFIESAGYEYRRSFEDAIIQALYEIKINNPTVVDQLITALGPEYYTGHDFVKEVLKHVAGKVF